jgi:hypothetical protein
MQAAGPGQYPRRVTPPSQRAACRTDAGIEAATRAARLASGSTGGRLGQGTVLRPRTRCIYIKCAYGRGMSDNHLRRLIRDLRRQASDPRRLPGPTRRPPQNQSGDADPRHLYALCPQSRSAAGENWRPHWRPRRRGRNRAATSTPPRRRSGLTRRPARHDRRPLHEMPRRHSTLLYTIHKMPGIATRQTRATSPSHDS